MKEKETEWRQGFFDRVEPIRLADPLSYVLGSQKEGATFVFKYSDAVKLAGHSCPAVSGAYKLTARALTALYQDKLPVRGGVRVLIKGGPEQLAYGPQSQVISLITGAAGEAGFKGLRGLFSRNKKLVFDTEDFQFNTFIFQREDTGKTVKVVYNPDKVPVDPEINRLMPLVLDGTASEEEKDRFIALWQGKVKKILLEDEKYPGLFEVEELKDFRFPGAGGARSEK
jgi:formylmethanofuran dehydrogenase subunit E